MFFNLFCNYLIDTGRINEAQYEELKVSQNKTRVKLGLIAVSEQMITEKQAEEINRKQAVLDKRFGDIAVDLGYISNNQLSKLLDLQGNAYMVFCQNITDRGYMTLEEVGQAMAEYSMDMGFDKNAEEAFKSDDIEKYISYYIPECDDKCCELISVAVRTINRIISTDIFIEKGSATTRFESSGFAYQVLEGDFDVLTGIAGSQEGMLELASIFGEESFSEVNDDVLDAVGEFINIVNGLFATNLCYKKINVDMLPPKLCSETAVISNKHIIVMPVQINSKKIDLFVAFN